MVVNGRVYNGSAILHSHPGGNVLTTYLGKDATDVFWAFHSGSAKSKEWLDRLYMGELSEPLEGAGKGGDGGTAFERDYRALTHKFKSAGLFESNALYYLWKVASTAAIAIAAVYVTVMWSGFWSKMLGAVLLGLFWQQSGWLSHDFGHHQVFRNRVLNDCVILMTGPLWLGFSRQWWSDKHNTHHAIPNQHESGVDLHDGDPDIDTLPFLAWSRYMARKALAMLRGGDKPSAPAPAPAPAAKPSTETTGSGSGFSLMRLVLANQQLAYFPLLLFARLSWAIQSFSYAYQLDTPGVFAEPKLDAAAVAASAAAAADASAAASAAAVPVTVLNAMRASKARIQYPITERSLIAVHWIAYAALLFSTMSVPVALLYALVTQLVSGFGLALAFGVGHNGMPIFDADKRPLFAELQVRTTRNVHDSAFGFTGWFMGGLHFQIEHHLWPTMPRHSLAKVAPAVRELCAKHNVPYHCTGLWEGTGEVLAHLAEVATELHAHGPQ